MSTIETYGLLLAAGVLGVTLLLVGGHWSELRGRARSESIVENDHYARQGARRRLMSTLMIAQALLIVVGSTVPPNLKGAPNPVFVLVWMSVCVLVLSLLVLAAIDWFMIQRFARQMRREIVRRGMESLQADLRDRGGQETPRHLGNGFNSLN